MRLLALFLILLSLACGRSQADRPQASDRDALAAKAQTYATLVLDVQAEAGFIHADECDSLLFSSLLAASGYADVAVTAAEASPGRWLRRPASLPECWLNGLSRSTISRDQLLGVLWWAWRHQRLDVLDRLWAYGAQRAWLMGEDNLGGGHTVLVPILPLVARVRKALGGPDSLYAYLPLPSEFDDGKTGFEAHLQVLQLMLDDEVRGGLGPSARARLREQAERQPQNPLFRLAAGDVDEATRLLLEHPAWPEGRLPTTADRKAPWVLERDYGPDWEPGMLEEKQLTGADLLFVAHLILRR